MITKKFWDSLPLSAKRQVLAIMFGDDFEAHSQLKNLLYEYRHNFDFNDTGKRLKKVLQHCYYGSADNTVVVKVDVTFSTIDNNRFIPSPQPVKKISTPVATPIQKKHWRIDYNDKEGDLCHVHCYAYDKEDARDYALGEYWDIKEIIQICEIK